MRLMGPIVELHGETFTVDARAGGLHRRLRARRASFLRVPLAVGSIVLVELLLYEPGQARIVGIATP